MKTINLKEGVLNKDEIVSVLRTHDYVLTQKAEYKDVKISFLFFFSKTANVLIKPAVYENIETGVTIQLKYGNWLNSGTKYDDVISQL